MKKWLSSRSWQCLLAMSWLLVMAGAALLAGWLPLAYEPATPDLDYLTTSPFAGAQATHHWLGTDPLGRDVLANLLFGARTALLISVPAALLTTLLGVLLGSSAGFWRNRGLRPLLPYWLVAVGLAAGALAWPGCLLGESGWLWTLAALMGGCFAAYLACRLPVAWPRVPFPIDHVVLWLIGLLESIPRLLLIIAVAAVQEASIVGLLLLLTLTGWPTVARLVRASLLQIGTSAYIEAARAAGLPAIRILACHALPNVWHIIRAAIPQTVATIIAFETTLSFLGVGLPPEQPSWGRILATVRLAPTAWWLMVPPALCILSTMLALRQVAATPLRQGQ